MTRGEIGATLAACTVIGGAIVAKAAFDLVRSDCDIRALSWTAPIIVFVVSLLATGFVRAIREIQSRRSRTDDWSDKTRVH